MREEKIILEEIRNWANSNETIRMIILTGSRANPDAPVDLFSDYDIEVCVNGLSGFSSDQKWICHFGEVTNFFVEKNKDYMMCLVLYRDYVRIDFKVYDLCFLKEYIDENNLPQHLDNGFKVVVDKDSVAKKLKSPSCSAFLIEKPTSDEFAAVVNDFWWDVTYVAKSLWRNELYYAKYMMEHIRFCYLEKMVEWYTGLQHEWKVSTNKHGRLFKKFLDKEIYNQLEQTFAGDDITENWKALFKTIKLFRHSAIELAKALYHNYPYEIDKDVTIYLEKIKRLDGNASDII